MSSNSGQKESEMTRKEKISLAVGLFVGAFVACVAIPVEWKVLPEYLTPIAELTVNSLGILSLALMLWPVGKRLVKDILSK